MPERMTLLEAKDKVEKTFGRAWQSGPDLHVTNSCNWTWHDLRHLAEVLGTEAIDFDERQEFNTLPYFDTIAGRYENDGGGCNTCGHGAVVIVRGILVE